MGQQKSERNLGFALVVGIGLGLLIAFIRRKMAIGLLIGIIVAAILYKRDKR